MQDLEIQGLYKATYWDWGVGGLLGTIFFTGLSLFLAKSFMERKIIVPSEPILSISLLLMTWSLAYPIAGFLGSLLGSSHPWYFFTLTCVTVSCFILLNFLKTRHNLRRLDSLAAELSNFQIATDIKDIFDNPQDPSLIKALTLDLSHSNSINITSIGHNTIEENSGLWNALANFNGQITIFSDTSQHNNLKIQYHPLPEIISDLMRGVFVIDCGQPFYFGIGSNFDQLPIARFDGKGGDRESISLGVRRLTTQLSQILASDHAVMVRSSMSPEGYKEMILPLENKAKTIHRFPKRLFVVFKSQEVIRAIAEKRYGPGNSNVDHYIEEHAERRSNFFASLRSGMTCKEIYNKSEVITYVTQRKHGSVSLTAGQIKETLMLWLEALEIHDPYYQVGLTDTLLPFKYELIDDTHFILHEAIGGHDDSRMNGFCITGKEFCRKPRADFDFVWKSIPAAEREKKNVIKWIKKELLPLCRSRRA